MKDYKNYVKDRESIALGNNTWTFEIECYQDGSNECGIWLWGVDERGESFSSALSSDYGTIQDRTKLIEALEKMKNFLEKNLNELKETV